MPVTVKRKPLSELLSDLETGKNITNRAVSGQGFDPRGGWGVAAAQIATAGIGAWAQNRAEKEIAEKEIASQDAFAKQFPQYAGLAGQLSPETRKAYTVEAMKASLKEPVPLSAAGKKASDIDKGFLPKGTSLDAPEDLQKKRAATLKQTKDLRREFTDNSGEFIKQRDAFGRIQASVEDPSAAGDLALIFNYMKLLDPGSTVREGEFATAQNSGSIPARLIAKYNNVMKGERLADEQRNDFFARSNKLFDKATNIHLRRVKQFTGIAERNNLPVEDIILDFIGNIRDEGKKQEQDEVENVEAGQSFIPDDFKDLDDNVITQEIARRRGQK